MIFRDVTKFNEISYKIMNYMTCNQSLPYSMIYLAVLGGEVAVPCTRNPLMRDLIPSLRLRFCEVCPKHVVFEDFGPMQYEPMNHVRS